MPDSNTFDSQIGLALADQWNFFNNYYLSDQLREPSFTLFEGTSQFGYWAPESRIIGISKPHIKEHSWTRVMETLKHEMAHQYASEVLQGEKEPPHGDAFKYACHKLRISSKAKESWYFQNLSDSQSAQNPVIAKVSKLLSLAQSPNENEAQSAMKKARELLLRYQINEGEIDSSTNTYQFLEIGPAKLKFSKWEKKLMSILQDYFFVKIIWIPSLVKSKLKIGSVPLAHGSNANLAMADYVYDYFCKVRPKLWKDFKQSSNLTSDRPRMDYYLGVTYGFAEKLSEQNKQLASSKSLVWSGDPNLDEFYYNIHPHIQVRRSSQNQVHESFRDGQQRGRAVTLNKPIVSSQDSNSTKLLS